jgi:Uncharacterized conserved small protein
MTAMTDKTPTPDSTVSADLNPSGANPSATNPAQTGTETDAALKGPEQKPGEIGGPQGPEPTRYGDWEFKGRCSDF